MTGAITFDFHNTLMRCDRWFELEVRGLPASFLRWRAERRNEEVDPELLAAADAAYRRLRRAVIADGVEVPAEAGVARVLAELGRPTDEAEIAAGVETLMREALPETAPFPGAVATVRALAAAGVPLGVVSSAVYHPFLDWSLSRHGLRDAFADVTTSASAGFYKSRPEIYRHAAAALGVAPAQIVHVGDSSRFDVAGAGAAGLRTAWLRPPDAAPGDGRPPDLTLSSLDGAAPRLLALLRAARP